MRRSCAVILLLYYCCGQIFLPEGNFAYLAQMPDLYREFVAVNDMSDVDDFLEEEFFDVDRLFGEDPDKDEPFEKEAKQVPFRTIPFSLSNSPLAAEQADEFTPPDDAAKFTAFYPASVHSAEIPPVFHPPKA